LNISTDSPIFLALDLKQFKYTIKDDRLWEQMNHKMTSIAKDHKTVTALVVLAAVAAVLVTSTAAVGTGHMALAANGNKTKGNDGISVPTVTKQPQECETAGGTSPVTGACTATSTNTITESGGVLSEEGK
jgi:hypothetical protein